MFGTLRILTVGAHTNLQILSHRSLFLKLTKQSITRTRGGGGCHAPVEEIQEISDIIRVNMVPLTRLLMLLLLLLLLKQVDP